jgi:hypothetical protein
MGQVNKMQPASIEFRKSLAQYYHGWFRNCHDSAIYCINKGWAGLANEYLEQAKRYNEIIQNNFDAIEFFSINDNAFKIDSALPVEYRGYK